MLPAIAGLAIELIPEAIKWFTDDNKTVDAAKDIANIAKKVTGLEDEKSAIEAIKLDPEKALEFKLAVMRDAHRLDELYLEDKKDAREMYKTSDHETTDEIANKIMTWNLPMIGGIAILQILVLAIIPVWIQIDPTVSALVGNLCGWIIKGLFDERLQVCNFFFGSSKGSKEKSKQQDSLLNKFGGK